MRQIDPKILEILKTETSFETALKTCPKARELLVEEVRRGSGNPDTYAAVRNSVAIGRVSRYVPQPPHRNYLIEISYMVSGECRIGVTGREIVVRQGDIFIPNQYTVFSREAMGENDIMVSFIVRPRFLENVCMQLKTGSPLSEFMLDTLRQEVCWDRYLHFTGVDDIAVTDLIETMLYAAFPYLDNDNIRCGSTPEPQLTVYLLTALFISLSRNLEALSEDSPVNYDDMIRQTVRNYIATEYKTGTLKELAVLLNQTESNLSRQVKSMFGFTFMELLLQKRFERAVDLLEKTELPAGAIAEAVGYESTSFFYRRFRSIYGISPKDYRKRQQA